MWFLFRSNSKKKCACTSNQVPDRACARSKLIGKSQRFVFGRANCGQRTNRLLRHFSSMFRHFNCAVVCCVLWISLVLWFRLSPNKRNHFVMATISVGASWKRHQNWCVIERIFSISFYVQLRRARFASSQFFFLFCVFSSSVQLRTRRKRRRLRSRSRFLSLNCSRFVSPRPIRRSPRSLPLSPEPPSAENRAWSWRVTIVFGLERKRTANFSGRHAMGVLLQTNSGYKRICLRLRKTRRSNYVFVFFVLHFTLGSWNFRWLDGFSFAIGSAHICYGLALSYLHWNTLTWVLLINVAQKNSKKGEWGWDTLLTRLSPRCQRSPSCA